VTAEEMEQLINIKFITYSNKAAKTEKAFAQIVVDWLKQNPETAAEFYNQATMSNEQRQEQDDKEIDIITESTEIEEYGRSLLKIEQSESGKAEWYKQNFCQDQDRWTEEKRRISKDTLQNLKTSITTEKEPDLELDEDEKIVYQAMLEEEIEEIEELEKENDDSIWIVEEEEMVNEEHHECVCDFCKLK
jgi:hypothetical protein